MTEAEAPQPLVDWQTGAPPWTIPGVVWFTTMDGHKYQVEVHRTGDYSGRLLMWDISGVRAAVMSPPPWPVVLDEEIPLAYGARFGPDMDDVSSWQTKCIEIADARADREGA